MPQATLGKKPVSVLATSTLATEADKKGQKVILDLVPYIYYLVQLWKDKRETIWALINSSS